MGITDEKLGEDKILVERETAVRTIMDEPSDYDVRRYTQNVADWLVVKFCRICPHREA